MLSQYCRNDLTWHSRYRVQSVHTLYLSLADKEKYIACTDPVIYSLCQLTEVKKKSTI